MTDYERMVRAYWRNPDEAALAVVVKRLEAAKEAGTPSNVWHEVHRWVMDNVTFPACTYCGGPVDPRRDFHLLCKARAERGLPISKLDVRGSCPCIPCQASKKGV